MEHRPDRDRENLAEDISIVATLWEMFVAELRERWEERKAIPAVDTAAPDLRACLVQQKLQILNRCISLSNKSSDDEVKRAEVEEEMLNDTIPQGIHATASVSMRLIGTGQPMNVPITQDHPVIIRHTLYGSDFYRYAAGDVRTAN